MNDFSQCLAGARRKAGLSQVDCAHLLGMSQSRMSRLELGHAKPTVSDLVGVALLFGRSMELMVEPMFQEYATQIHKRLFDLPETNTGWLGQFARNNALAKLEARVDRIIAHYGH